jgi:hypothetical protein
MSFESSEEFGKLNLGVVTKKKVRKREVGSTLL